jgi:hypothetical protein
MATTKNDQGSRWRGDEVEGEPGDQAERAAERAEGNSPIPADELQRREAESSATDEGSDDPIRRAPSGESPDEKIEDAADAHRDQEPAEHRPLHGKL